MKKMSLLALFVGAALFTGLGATSLLAAEGKCGTSKPAKCGAEKKATKCGAGKKDGNVSKCGAKKDVPKAGKCGTGKCGK